MISSLSEFAQELFGWYAGIKPVACSKALCSHQFDEMGFGASMDVIYNLPAVADLLISMAAAAASNPRKEHRERFFACPNPPSDFVSWGGYRRDANVDPNNKMGIDWATLQRVCFLNSKVTCKTINQ